LERKGSLVSLPNVQYDYEIIYMSQENEYEKIKELGVKGYGVVGINDNLIILERVKPIETTPEGDRPSINIDISGIKAPGMDVKKIIESAEFRMAFNQFLGDFLLRRRVRSKREEPVESESPFIGNLGQCIQSERRKVVSPEGSREGLDEEEDEETETGYL
jgi:hypothetical protein